MRRHALLASSSALIVMLTGAAAAHADVWRGGVSDPKGDAVLRGPDHEGPTALGDARRLDVDYDSGAGRLAVTVAFEVPLDTAVDIAGFEAALGQASRGSSCAAGGAPGDLTLSAKIFMGMYRDDGTDIYPPSSSAVTSGVGVPDVGGSTSLSRDRTRLTMTVQDAALAHRGYRCLTRFKHTQYCIFCKHATEDLAADLFLSRVHPPPDPEPQPARVTIPSVPSLNSVRFQRGDTVTASARFVNTGGKPAGVRYTVITARRPGEPRHGGLVDNFTGTQGNLVIAAGATVHQSGTLRLPADALAGRWEIYASWQDYDRRWHEGPVTHITVDSAPSGTPTGGQATPGPANTPASSGGGTPPAGPGGPPDQGTTAGEPSAPRPGAALSPRTVRLRGRTADVRATCAGAERSPMLGRLSLRTASRVRVASRRRIVTLGSATFRCHAKGELSVPVRLSPANARLVRRLGLVRVRASVRVEDARGRSGRAAATFTLTG